MNKASKSPTQTIESAAEETARLKQEVADLQKINLKLRKRLAELGGADVFRNRYLGEAATTYDERRSTSKMWLKEDAAVDGYLAKLGEGRSVLDVPVGTGRFIPLYRKYKSIATGIDTSPDMLAIARQKSVEHDYPIDLSIGDVMKLPISDGQFDVVVCIRLLNFFRADELDVVIAEIARVARRNLILTIRTQTESNEPLYAGDKNTIVHPQKRVDELIAANKFSITERSIVGVSGVGQNRVMLLTRQ